MDRSEYDDRNTDEPSSVITQLPHMHAVRSLRRDRVSVLRSDRASIPFGRCVATELEPKLGRYVATELFRNVDTTLVHAFSSTLRCYLPKAVANPFHASRHSKSSIKLYRKNRGKSPFSSRTSIKAATMSRGSVSIYIRTEVSIDVEWKMSVDGRRMSSVDGGERVSVDETGVWVDGG
ncbi:hypothetical protein DY000_02048218 [Brassica cretica]|uniref:Uncharacterized protein n=1 Tax=Brassica cretica TaxID=69181 RepID=A0ABQ7EPP8_BRACR|nr:hypothetical protein DY000_02048218 [Brassica cretica]